MDKSKYIELINKEIDGEITSAEKEQLTQVISNDAQARKSYQELVNIASRLNDVELIDPPRSLFSKIQRSIDPDLYKTHTNHLPGFWQELQQFLLPKRNIAFAFVSGLLIGLFCIFIFYHNEPGSDFNLSGAIGLTTVIDQQQFSVYQNTITGNYALKRDQKLVSLDLNINTSTPCQVNLTYPQKGLQLTDFRSDSPQPVRMNSDSNGLNLEVTNDAGFTLIFKNDTAESGYITLEITSQQNMLLKKNILLN